MISATFHRSETYVLSPARTHRYSGYSSEYLRYLELPELLWSTVN